MRLEDTELTSKHEETEDYKRHVAERARESQEIHQNLRKLSTGHDMTQLNPKVGGY